MIQNLSNCGYDKKINKIVWQIVLFYCTTGTLGQLGVMTQIFSGINWKRGTFLNLLQNLCLYYGHFTVPLSAFPLTKHL